jgi:hypothetical protein
MVVASRISVLTTVDIAVNADVTAMAQIGGDQSL